MCEDYGLCTCYKHHKIKILHTLSAMRSFKDELLELGANVHYSAIEDKGFKEDYISKLIKLAKREKYNRVFFYEIEC